MGRLEINCINVGNGDAILLELYQDHGASTGDDCLWRMLIDAGSGMKSEFAHNDTGRIPAAVFLRAKGITNLDVLVNTHIHEDHTGGMPSVIRAVSVREYWQPFSLSLYQGMKPIAPADIDTQSGQLFAAALNAYRETMGALKEKGTELTQVERGTCLTVGSKRDNREDTWPDAVYPAMAGSKGNSASLQLQVIAPGRKRQQEVERMLGLLFSQRKEGNGGKPAHGTAEEYTDERLLAAADAMMNSVSIVIMAEYGGRRVLLSGDDAAVDLAALSDDLSADILKVGHHGQKNALTNALVGRIHPQIAVISASSDRRYESASPYTLGILREHHVKTLFTDWPAVPPYTNGLRPHSGVKITIHEDGSIQYAYMEEVTI